MARPPKNFCDYFSHDNDMRDHKKIKAIRAKYKIAGYGIWCMILEYLTGNDGNVFEYSDLEFELMAGDFCVSVTEIREVVDYCIKLELLFLKDGFINSESLDERLKPVYDKRGVAKSRSAKQDRNNGKFTVNKPESIGVSVTETKRSETETPQSKVNESKVEESNNIHPSDEKQKIESVPLGDAKEQKNTKSWYEKEVVSTLNQGSDIDAQRKIAEYIRAESPDFYLPYKDLWNIFAGKYKLRKVSGMPKDRLTKFNSRIKEPAFDFLEILKAIRNSSNLRGENKNNWKVTWDYIMRSETTYLQIIEDSKMPQN